MLGYVSMWYSRVLLGIVIWFSLAEQERPSALEAAGLTVNALAMLHVIKDNLSFIIKC